MEFLKLLWNLFTIVADILLIWLTVYSFWNGIKIETGNLVVELYGISRCFSK